MAKRIHSKRRQSSRGSVHKPNGCLHPRIEKVGPQRFGVACVDVAKAESDWMMCDFYGKVLIEAGKVRHTRSGFGMALLQLREAIGKHGIKDLIVAIERTGNYHLPVKRAFAAAGFETRIVHPFATKQFRQPASPGIKTDGEDLIAMHRATITGFGLVEPELDQVSQQLRLLIRHRRDLVEKRSTLCCQIREHLDATLPGYAAIFDNVWGSTIAMHVAREFPSPELIGQANLQGLEQSLRQAQIRVHEGVLQRIVTWAANAAMPHEAADVYARIGFLLDDDRAEKTRQIQALECEIASLLVHTPYVLLLSFPGINVVTAAELAGEMGPITHYANAKAITGRAGLFPSRHQSAGVDLNKGRIIRCSNRRLRNILMMIADNLIKCNLHFRALNAIWKDQGKDPRWSRVSVASRFTRILYQIVAGQQVYCHPSQRERSYILDKLVDFHRLHGTPLDKILFDLNAARQQIPQNEYGNEAVPLQARYERMQNRRRREPQPIGEILLAVLARLEVGTIELTSESRDSG